MDTSKYMPMWKRVEPIMRQHLISVLALMKAEGFTHKGIAEAGDEELRLDVSLEFNGELCGAFEFTLNDGDVQDGEGFAVSLGWFGDEAEVLAHAWRPENYSDSLYTWDEAEILRRLDEFSPSYVAATAAKDLLELRATKGA